MGKKKDDVTVKFISNSSVDVTGSGVLVCYKDREYLIEYGMLQGCGGTLEQEYIMNLQYSKNINIDKIKCVLISHQNIDHIGLIPSLVKRGFMGNIYGSYESLEFSKRLLEDSAFIIDRNVNYIASKGRKVEHLYKEQDVATTCNNMISCDTNRIYKFDEYMSFQFVPTNHLTGSRQIIMWIRKENSNIVKIHYTGDLGNELNKKLGYFLKDTEIVTTSNLIISECTYFGNIKDYTIKDALDERKDMRKNIWEVLHSNGKVVIPCFSMQRSQQIMLEVWKMFKDDKNFDFPIIVDSRLTKRINNVFSRVLINEDKKIWEECINWRNFKFIESYPDTIALMSTRKPMVVISSSGMAQSGHIIEWLKSSIDCSRDMIMVVGYTPEGSILDKLVKGQENIVKWDKRTFQVRCRVKKYNTFSSHISANDLIKMLNQINTGMVVFHHGSKEAKENAVRLSREELNNIGKTPKIIAAYKGLEIKL